MTQGSPKKVAPQPTKRDAHFVDVAERLGDRLNTRVQIAMGARKGRVTIDFANAADLNRILSELGAEDFAG